MQNGRRHTWKRRTTQSQSEAFISEELDHPEGACSEMQSPGRDANGRLRTTTRAQKVNLYQQSSQKIHELLEAHADSPSVLRSSRVCRQIEIHRVALTNEHQAADNPPEIGPAQVSLSQNRQFVVEMAI